MVSSWEACRFAIPDASEEGWLWPWLAPVLTTPCFEHWIVSAVSAILCLLILVSTFFSRGSVLVKGLKLRASRYFWTTLYLAGAVSFIQISSAIWKLVTVIRSRFPAEELEDPEGELVFSLSQSLTWVLFSVVIFLEKSRSIQVHPPLLRVSWILNFLLSMFMLSSAIAQLQFFKSPETIVNDVVPAAINAPVSLFLLVAACIGDTGVVVSEIGEQNGHLGEPLLGNGYGELGSSGLEGKGEEGGKNAAGYDNAGIFSRLGFMWLSPVLKKGSQKALEVVEIPSIGTSDTVETAYEKFMEEWNREHKGERFLPFILIRANWSTFILTAFLGLIKLSVMYVGPLLIQRFIDFTAMADRVWYRGAALVGYLLLAKSLEVIADHQYNFFTNKIGMSVWGGLVSAVYQKGLKITSSARQSYGVGKIVNFMSVDAQDVSSVCLQLHDLWLLPIQIALALVILSSVVGVATFAGLGTMLVIMIICLLMASKQQSYQVNIMAGKDRRMKVTNEALSSMKIIKLCAWQEKFLARIEGARASERVWIGKLMYIAALSIFFLWLSPLAVSVFTFGTCVVLGIELTAGKVFTAIATFRILQEPLRSFPQIVMAAVQAMVSVRRLKSYLESPELDPGAVQRLPPGESYAVVVKNGVFKWEPKVEAPTLKNIDVHVRTGSLVAIVGTVGSGKSALLSCVLGEMENVEGSVTVSGTMAYVPQSAWIQNGSIKDNILFGKPFDESLYKHTLKVCALEGDLAQMIRGDQTEIGERGINLSGGQKQRVQLARAIYQDADVYLLDDIFSALDAHTGSSIFQECIRGTLSGKTVLLVTHQVEFLHGVDLILVMRNGEIVQSGKYDDLKNQGTDFGALVDAHNESLESHDFNDEVSDEDELGRDDFTGQFSIIGSPNLNSIVSGRELSGSVGSGDSSPGRLSTQQSLERTLHHQGSGKFGSFGRSSSKRLRKQTSSSSSKPIEPRSSAKLIEDEERETGRVGTPVYWAYATKVLFGGHIVALLFIQIIWQGLQIASDLWLAQSTSAESLENFDSVRFLSVYTELAIGSGIFVLARSLVVSFSGLRTAQKFFIDMIRSVFRAPMSFFDTTPTGRVLSRSSTDQISVDFYIPFIGGTILAVGFQLLGALVVMAGVTWQTVFIIVPLGFIFVRYQQYFIATSRELTRLQSITEAPIIQHFSETISGFATVRGFGHQDRFIATNMKLVNTNRVIRFHEFSANEWLGFRLESIGTFILCSSALILVLLPEGMIQPELVGLSLSYGMALNTCLFWLVTSVSRLEQNMVAVERILQYSDLPSEAPLVIDNNRPDPSWPSKGSITMKNLQMRYRKDTPLVLKGVSFTIEGGEKLGVVGRTGSGKSSLIQALFRLIEPAGGKIVVDNVDITTIGLSDLRSKFSIIPQEPTLFEGNVRNNVDPLGEHTDEQIWEALDKCQLGDYVREKEEKLEYTVAENGENWSMGQRQLFCLGRALLKKSRILVLDEATASVDTQTDIVLQRTISREFSTSTVISIAHRIPSVMDSDKVLVLEDGFVKEFGSPSSLLDHSSLFSALVHEYWNRSNSLNNLIGAGAGEELASE